jgi:hypothetical protein
MQIATYGRRTPTGREGEEDDDSLWKSSKLDGLMD